VNPEASIEPLVENWNPAVIVLESAEAGFAGMPAHRWPDSRVLCLSDPGGPVQSGWKYLSGEPSGTLIDAGLKDLLANAESAS